MNNRRFITIRWKILALFLISILLSIITVFVLLQFASVLARDPALKTILRWLQKKAGVIPISVLVGILLFIAYFFIISSKSIRYLEEINIGLKQISRGDLDTKIPIRTKDELGQLANNINSMAKSLNNSIEEERNAEKTKNELVTSISHDLRTPLTSIIGYLGLIANDNYKDELTLRYYVDIAYNKSLSLKKLIDELFDFTKISYGGIKPNFENIDIVQLIEQLAEEFIPILNEAGMVYRFTPAVDKILIKGDGDLLVRVFENLFSNAIRYGSEGKYIDIEVTTEKDKVVIQIINYGIGISEMDLPYIFDRFYKADKSRTQSSEGSGLGLAIAKNIIKLHNGEIKAVNNKGRTEFEISIPRLKS